MAAQIDIAPAFADAPRQSQSVFRAVMNALSRPGSPQALAAGIAPPAPLTAELAAVALSLCDGDAPIWLDPPLARAPAVAAFLRFHTNAPIVADPGEAVFAFVTDVAAMLPLDTFALGTEEYPDRSTTIVMAVDRLTGKRGFTIEGPGVKDFVDFAADPLPADFAGQWRENHRKFPRGVDLVFAVPGEIAALPRSSRIVEGG